MIPVLMFWPVNQESKWIGLLKIIMNFSREILRDREVQNTNLMVLISRLTFEVKDKSLMAN